MNVNLLVLMIDDSRYVVVAGRVEPMVVPRAVEGYVRDSLLPIGGAPTGLPITAG